MIQIPKLKEYQSIQIGNTTIKFYTPQIASGMAMIPIITKAVEFSPEIIDESMMNAELRVLDDAGSYDRLSLQNDTENDVIIPAATHFVGGQQNRGLDKMALLRKHSQRIVVDAHCFEPGRGSGSNRFNRISETPIDIIFKTKTTKGTGASWEAIGEYTKILGRNRDSMEFFLQNTGLNRLHIALNFETLKQQTGVACMVGNEGTCNTSPK